MYILRTYIRYYNCLTIHTCMYVCMQCGYEYEKELYKDCYKKEYNYD